MLSAILASAALNDFTVANSVNRGISTVRRMHIAYTIRLSINKDLKLKKRKGRDRQQHKKLYTITRSREGYVSSASTITAVFCQYRNIYYSQAPLTYKYLKYTTDRS